MLSRRIKRYPINLSTLSSIFSNLGNGMHPHYQFHDIPPDARVVGLRLDDSLLDRLYVFVESETFNEVPECCPPPDEAITVTSWYCQEYLKDHRPKD